MRNLAKKIGELLTKKNKTLSLAESCTGGLTTSLLTDIPGSSAYILGGVISYTNGIKNKVLGVPTNILSKYTAISPETAIAMVKGVRKLTGSDYALAITGNAGPGTSEGKPLGLVYIALDDSNDLQCKEFHFSYSRVENKEKIAQTALKMLLKKLEE